MTLYYCIIYAFFISRTNFTEYSQSVQIFSVTNVSGGLDVQWTLSISNTLYLELLSISNNFLCPLDISIDSSLIFSLYLEPPYLELLFISNKNVGPMQIFLSLSRTFQPSHRL